MHFITNLLNTILLLRLIEAAEVLKDDIVIENTSQNVSVVFRIRVSVPNLFVLKTSEGVLDPGARLSIPVVLKSMPGGSSSDENPLAKFAVEFLECEDDYYIMGAKAFWKAKSDTVEVKKILSKAEKNLKEEKSSPAMPLAEAVNVSPQSLCFQATDPEPH